MWIDNSFPNIGAYGYTVTSNPSDDYNCIAWAVGDTTSWWSHLSGYYWPIAERSPLVENLVAMFVEMGYGTCENASLEDGFDKVTIFQKAGLWKHAARQLPNGKWTSKLGLNEDIEHASPDDLSGELYGTVHCIMRKKRT